MTVRAESSARTQRVRSQGYLPPGKESHQVNAFSVRSLYPRFPRVCCANGEHASPCPLWAGTRAQTLVAVCRNDLHFLFFFFYGGEKNASKLQSHSDVREKTCRAG